MQQKAFTLVELAIVIVIIGLLVGGVLQGQELIAASKRNSIIKDFQSFKAGYFAFIGKYNCIPGDCIRATIFFGAADGGDGLGADCRDVISNDMATCNGNGNNKIELQNATSNEKLRAWQQLAYSKVIKGTYTGAFNSSGNMEVGVNAPSTSFSKVGYEMTYSSRYSRSGHSVKIAAEDSTGLNKAGLSPADTYIIDTKMDDGLSYTGILVATDSYDVAGCVTNGNVSTVGTTGEYYLTSSVPSCRAYIWIDN